MNWYDDPTNPLVVGSHDGDLGAKCMVLAARLAACEHALKGLMLAWQESGSSTQHPAYNQAREAIKR